MAAVTKKKKTAARKQLLIAAVIGFCTLLIVFALVSLSVTPVKYDISVGEVAPVSLTASRDVIDTVSTNAAIDQVRADVQPIYTIISSITQESQQAILSYFEKVQTVNTRVRNQYISHQQFEDPSNPREHYMSLFDASKVAWDEFLEPEDYNAVRSEFGDMSISEETVRAMAALNNEQIASMADAVISLASGAQNSGITEEKLDAEKAVILQNLTTLYPDNAKASVAYYPINHSLKANKLLDLQATQQAREEAAAEVQSIIYKQNQTVVVAGDVVTEAQYAVLLALGVVGSNNIDYMLYIGVFLLLALLFGVYSVYIKQFEPDVFSETRKLLVIASVIIIVTAIALPLARLDTRVNPVFFGTLLVCVLVSQRSALVLNILLASVTGLIASWQTGIMSSPMLLALVTAAVGGSVSVFALHKPGHRSSLLTAGLLGGAAGTAAVLLIGLVGSTATIWDNLFVDGAFALGSGLLGGVLAIGTLPIWEAVFRVSTPAKLLELSNLNHPLLKRLTVEAPGTYHHSVLTANLAEAGADTLGANALLCRVGAYFHDVGKLMRPRYFNENQKGENPHDELDPHESAKIITAHVEQGLMLAHRYKLPREVQNIMMQHHGDSIVPYFFHKASQAGLSPKEKDFKYLGSRPSTKESAIVMLADCVEAAVRSMNDPDRDQVKDMIDKLFRDKYNDGQLDDCPLSRRDLNRLAQAFLHVFDGALHERVKYPGQE